MPRCDACVRWSGSRYGCCFHGGGGHFHFSSSATLPAMRGVKQHGTYVFVVLYYAFCLRSVAETKDPIPSGKLLSTSNDAGTMDSSRYSSSDNSNNKSNTEDDTDDDDNGNVKYTAKHGKNDDDNETNNSTDGTNNEVTNQHHICTGPCPAAAALLLLLSLLLLGMSLSLI